MAHPLLLHVVSNGKVPVSSFLFRLEPVEKGEGHSLVKATIRSLSQNYQAIIYKHQQQPSWH